MALGRKPKYALAKIFNKEINSMCPSYKAFHYEVRVAYNKSTLPWLPV